MPVDFEDFPKEDLERLAAYQLQKVVDEAAVTVERKRVAEAVFKRNLGLPLTTGDLNHLAYSPFSPDTPGCHCGR
jgi:hypothetical protein